MPKKKAPRRKSKSIRYRASMKARVKRKLRKSAHGKRLP